MIDLPSLAASSLPTPQYSYSTIRDSVPISGLDCADIRLSEMTDQPPIPIGQIGSTCRGRELPPLDGALSGRLRAHGELSILAMNVHRIGLLELRRLREERRRDKERMRRKLRAA